MIERGQRQVTPAPRRPLPGYGKIQIEVLANAPLCTRDGTVRRREQSLSALFPVIVPHWPELRHVYMDIIVGPNRLREVAAEEGLDANRWFS